MKKPAPEPAQATTRPPAASVLRAATPTLAALYHVWWLRGSLAARFAQCAAGRRCHCVATSVRSACTTGVERLPARAHTTASTLRAHLATAAQRSHECGAGDGVCWATDSPACVLRRRSRGVATVPGPDIALILSAADGVRRVRRCGGGHPTCIRCVTLQYHTQKLLQNAQRRRLPMG